MTTTTASLVFQAAHAAAKVADAVVAYRNRFSTALKAAWAAAKQTIQTMSYDSNTHEQLMRDTYERHLAEAQDLTNEANQFRVGYAPSLSKPGLFISTDWRSINYLKKAQADGTLATRFPKQAEALNFFFKGDVQKWVAAMVANCKQAGRAQFQTLEQVQQKLNSLDLNGRVERLVREF